MFAVLRRAELESVINDSWAVLPGDDLSGPAAEAAAERAFASVEACNLAYAVCADRVIQTRQKEGVVYDVRRVLRWLKRECAKIQSGMLVSKKYCHERELLLG